MRTLFLLLLLIPFTASARVSSLHVSDQEVFFAAIGYAESGNSDHATGDRHLRNKAIGRYGIRKPYLTDVVRLARRDMVREWGHVLGMAEMRDERKARWVMTVYLHHYGERYARITGQRPTAEVYARIHNFGPNGWRSRATLAYWHGVRAYMRVYG